MVDSLRDAASSSWWERHSGRRVSGWSHWVLNQETEMKAGAQLFSLFLCFLQSRTSAHGRGPSTFRLILPTSYFG